MPPWLGVVTAIIPSAMTACVSGTPQGVIVMAGMAFSIVTSLFSAYASSLN